ncbi:site-specific DNA-methyltransferase [bacterium]|nr:site-specific DNA-methyltransferase [bacterium]
MATGDLFRLGRHRLVCGDSRTRPCCETAGEEESACSSPALPTIISATTAAGPTTPPTWRAWRPRWRPPSRGFPRAELRHGWSGAARARALDHVAYHSLLLEQQGLYFRDAIAWVGSRRPTASRRSATSAATFLLIRAFRWETLLVYRKPGRLYRMDGVERDCMAQFHTDVWEIPKVTRQMRRLGHPSVCPSEIPRRCLLAYVARGGWVLDPFAGSGTTLVAAEATGRRALLVERKPEYCEIALRRWEDSSGREVERL